jgi:hypothetical protein
MSIAPSTVENRSPDVSTASRHLRSSSRIRAAPCAGIVGCVNVWLPIACPAATVRRMSSGSRSAHMPMRKNVAFAS